MLVCVKMAASPLSTGYEVLVTVMFVCKSRLVPRTGQGPDSDSGDGGRATEGREREESGQAGRELAAMKDLITPETSATTWQAGVRRKFCNEQNLGNGIGGQGSIQAGDSGAGLEGSSTRPCPGCPRADIPERWGAGNDQETTTQRAVW